MRNHSYENDFYLHETACRTHFHVQGFSLRLVLKQRHKGTRKWPIACSSSSPRLSFPIFYQPLEMFHIKLYAVELSLTVTFCVFSSFRNDTIIHHFLFLHGKKLTKSAVLFGICLSAIALPEFVFHSKIFIWQHLRLSCHLPIVIALHKAKYLEHKINRTLGCLLLPIFVA